MRPTEAKDFEGTRHRATSSSFWEGVSLAATIDQCFAHHTLWAVAWAVAFALSMVDAIAWTAELQRRRDQDVEAARLGR